MSENKKISLIKKAYNLLRQLTIFLKVLKEEK